ncbi:F0F1 ATP synthase subunit A [Megalodesulfovibrio paquesii]
MAGGLPHPVLFANLTGVNDALSHALGVKSAVHIFYTWVAMAILFGIALVLRGKLKMVPSGLQNVMETVVGGLENFVVENVGEDGRKVFGPLCVIFVFILVQNLLGLVPGCDAPTANVNTNAAMALTVFIYYNAIGIMRWGPGYIKHFMGPMPVMAPFMLILEAISHIARPVSLTLRLFGNIRGEEVAMLLMFILAPIAGTIPIFFLFLLGKVLQAFIFFMLTMIYLKGSLEHAH